MLSVSIPDASRVRPITNCSRVDHQMSSGLLEEEVILKKETISTLYLDGFFVADNIIILTKLFLLFLFI